MLARICSVPKRSATDKQAALSEGRRSFSSKRRLTLDLAQIVQDLQIARETSTFRRAVSEHTAHDIEGFAFVGVPLDEDDGTVMILPIYDTSQDLGHSSMRFRGVFDRVWCSHWFSRS